MTRRFRVNPSIVWLAGAFFLASATAFASSRAPRPEVDRFSQEPTFLGVPALQMTTLYVFQGPPDAGYPLSTVTIHHNDLFGVSAAGGAYSIGAAYELTPTSSGYSERVLHSFKGGADGAGPYYGLAVGKRGKLYGTTTAGGRGAACSGGCGTVFELRPYAKAKSGYVERVIYSFQGGTDGSAPYDMPVVTSSGAIIGVTRSGGGASSACSGGCGTVFELTPSSSGYTETVVYRFQGGADGTGPVAGLVADSAGNLYGTTFAGGGGANCVGGCGTVFKLTPTASGYTESVLYAFQGGSGDGAYLYAGVILDRKGTIFGTTAWGGIGYGSKCDYNGFTTGCGIAFRLRPTASGYAKKTIYEFSDRSGDGAGGWGGLTLGKDGTLYGTTLFGGGCSVDYFGCGTVYQLTRTHGRYTFTLLYAFPGHPAAYPYSGVTYWNGALYGTTAQGGGIGFCNPTAFYCGTVYRLTL